MILPESIQNLIDAFSHLPGIGPKTASRLTFFLLQAPDNLTNDLAEALQALKENTSHCPICFNIMDSKREKCQICIDEMREKKVICVVEDPLDVIALEKMGSYHGIYHVLQGVLSPIEGIGPDHIRIRELIGRIRSGGIDEVIIATNPSLEGDATAMYLRQQIIPLGVRITRLARGLPVGGDLEYADPNTLLRAMSGRQLMD